MLLTSILGDRGHHESELLVIIRGGTLHGPTSRNMVEHPIAGLARWTGLPTRFEAIFRKEDDEKAMKEAAAPAATLAALQDETTTSSINPPATTASGVVPMLEVATETNTGGAASSSMGQLVNTPVGGEQAQFDVKIADASPKRNEFEEMPESRKVRKINGLAVCSMDIVGAAQADYVDPQSFIDEFERKAGEESDAVHTHEGEPMKSIEVPIPEQDIVGVKSGVVLDPAKVQAARQKEIDSIAKREVVELVKTSECKQGAHVKGGWVEDNKLDIVRSRFVAKQVAYNQRDDVSQSTPALLIFRLLLSIAVFIADFLRQHGGAVRLDISVPCSDG